MQEPAIPAGSCLHAARLQQASNAKITPVDLLAVQGHAAAAAPPTAHKTCEVATECIMLLAAVCCSRQMWRAAHACCAARRTRDLRDIWRKLARHVEQHC